MLSVLISRRATDAVLDTAEKRRISPGDEVAGWWTQHADHTWGAARPSEQETKKHAKCLRTKDEIVKYFRDYRGGQRKAQAAP